MFTILNLNNLMCFLIGDDPNNFWVLIESLESWIVLW